MANHISDTEPSNLKGKSTEQSMENSTPLEANPACEQDNNTDLIQITESPKAEVLQGTDQWATREDLYTIIEMSLTMIKTLHHILTTLMKVREHTISQKRSPLHYVAKRMFQLQKTRTYSTRLQSKQSFFKSESAKHVRSALPHSTNIEPEPHTQTITA